MMKRKATKSVAKETEKGQGSVTVSNLIFKIVELLYDVINQLRTLEKNLEQEDWMFEFQWSDSCVVFLAISNNQL